MPNENDENSSSTRVTRAKAAALNVEELVQPAKPFQSKKIGNGHVAQPAQRKRAALGDVSNVTKIEIGDAKKAGKPGLVSKAAQPMGIQKNTSRPLSRAPLAAKESNKKVDQKRSGPGAIGGVQKRKVSGTSSSSLKEPTPVDADEPVRKKVHTTEAENRKLDGSKEAIAGPAIAAADFLETKFEVPDGVKDLDSEDRDDPLMVAEYATEIFEYLRDLECNAIPNPQYMSHQDDLEWKTRGILVDWLIEVHTRFHLLPETLFLAVNIIDRFLSEKVVQLDRLQLVGVTAMFIASKYEEVLSPHVANFRHVADDGFTEAEILSAERFILSTLKYDLSYPNPMNFLRRISKADNYDIQSRTFAKYLMEISLLDHRFMAFRSSHIAASAMYLSRVILDNGPWVRPPSLATSDILNGLVWLTTRSPPLQDETIAYYSGYTEEEIEPVFILMIDYLARPGIHEAFFKKYASKKFLKGKPPGLPHEWCVYLC